MQFARELASWSRSEDVILQRAFRGGQTPAMLSRRHLRSLPMIVKRLRDLGWAEAMDALAPTSEWAAVAKRERQFPADQPRRSFSDACTARSVERDRQESHTSDEHDAERREILAEIWEDADSHARADEEGWYYDDES